jgi:hypothetical protein
VGVERHQRQEVDDHERREHAVGERPASERDGESSKRDQEHRADPFPEPVEEGDRRPGIALEAEPPTPPVLLNAAYVAEGLGEVDGEVRARGEKGDRSERGGGGETVPPAPAGDDERNEQDEARVLEARRQPDRDSGRE